MQSRPASDVARQRRARRAGSNQIAQFGAAPWLLWHDVHDDPNGSPNGALVVLESEPFLIDWGDRVARTCLAQLSGLLGVGVADIRRVAELGYLGWADQTSTAVACAPIDGKRL